MTERLNTGYAALSVDTGDVPVQVSGIAIGENDVTVGGSGKQTLWPRETLEEAAEGLEGQPIATSQNHTADGANPQTPSEAVVGQVTWSGYKPGVGVLYEGEIDDPNIARSVENGRLEVSPLVSRDIEPLEKSDKAEYIATEITRWRDLATVVNGAAPSNEITVGDNPMKAEALFDTIEALQDVDLTPPESVQNNAQKVLDWREDPDKEVSGMTDTGWNRAEQLASGEELSVNDIQEIAAWFARHGEDEYELNEEGMDPWKDNGRVAILGWGGESMREWVDGKRSRLVETGDLDPLMTGYALENPEALQLESARTPEYDGTETSSWGDVSKDLSDVTDAVGIDADTVSDLSQEQKQAIADHTLLGDPEAESWGEMFFFPVVNPNTGNLNENALDAVRGGRGAQADIPEDAYNSAEEMARSLLEDEFDREFESMASVDEVSEGSLVRWNSSGDRDAYGMVEEVRTEGDDPLDSEIDGDQTINPPAALITVHTPGEDGWAETDTQVGHTLNTDTLTVIDELPNPESLAEHKMEGMQNVPEEYVFSNPGEAMNKAQEMGMEEIHSHGEGDNTVFMPGATHSALLDELDMGGDDGTDESMSPSNPADDTSETMDEITDEELEALEQRREFENPKLVEQNDYEALQSRVAEVRSVMEESLAEETNLKESTVEALSFEALCSEFETEDGEMKIEAMRQTPESGEPETETEALSDADMDKAEALYQDYQTFENERLKDDIQEALGVEDWDKATEVLN